IDGKLVSSSLTFIAKEANGFVDLEFTFNASALEGQTLVAFESLTREDQEIATHKDIEDEDQSVRVTNPEIGTSASNKDDGLKVVDPLNNIVIRDEVKYTDLVVGKEYTIKGVLMSKETGKALLVNGKTVTSELVFVATT